MDQWAKDLTDKCKKPHGLVALLGGTEEHLKQVEKLNPGAIVYDISPNQNAVLSFEPPNLERFLAVRQGFLSSIAPGIEQEYPEVCVLFKKKCNLFIESLVVNASGTKKHHKIWHENAIKNVPAIIDSVPVSRLFGKWRDKPALLIGGGPSLDREKEYIARCQGRMMLMASGTALRWCNHHGIKPDVVVSIDPGKGNYEAHFKGQCRSDVPLIYDHRCHYEVARNWPGPKYICSVINNSFVEKLIFKQSFGRIDETGPSVMNIMFTLCRKMKSSPIILIGSDLCFDGAKSHAKHTHNEKDPDSSVWKNHVQIRKVDGSLGVTNPQMRQMCVFYERFIRPDDFVINCSYGAKIPHTRDVPLRDIVEMLERENKTCKFHFNGKKVKYSKRNIIKSLEKIQAEGEKLLELEEMSYESLWEHPAYGYLFLPVMFSDMDDGKKIAEIIQPKIQDSLVWLKETLVGLSRVGAFNNP